MIRYVMDFGKQHPRKLGYLLACITAISLSFIGFTIKLVDRSIPILWIAIFRFILMSALFTPFMLRNKGKAFRIKHPFLLVFRCLFAFLAMLLFFSLSRHTTLNEASLFMNTTPMYVALFSFIFFQIKIKPLVITGLILSFLGVILIYTPSENLLSTTLFMGITLGFLGACVLTILKKLVTENSSLAIAFYLTLPSSIISLCFIPLFPYPHFSRADIIILLISTGCGISFQLCLNLSTKLLGPVIVSEMLLLSVIISGVLDIIVWQFMPSSFHIAGLMLVLIGILLVTRYQPAS